MTVRFCDGFDKYAADADLADKWDVVNAAEFDYEAAGGRFGGGAIRIFDNQIAVEKAFTPVTEIYFACSIKVAGAFDNIGATDIIELQNREGDSQLALRMNDDDTTPPGALTFRRGLFTEIGDLNFGFTVDSWHHLEIHMVVDDTSGSVEVRIDGDTKLDVSGTDTVGNPTADIGRLVIRGYDATTPATDGLVIDDVVLHTFGDFIGDHRIQTLTPDGAGNSSEWTPSAGTRHEAVDETVSDDDDTYVSESTLTDSDLYTVDDPAIEHQTVHAVVVNTVARATGTTPKALRAQVRHGSTTGNGSAVDIPDDSSYHLNQTAFVQNPDTVAAWEGSELADLEIGQDLNG